MLFTADLLLLNMIKDLIADLSNPNIYYIIMARCYEIDDEKRYLLPVYLNSFYTYNIELTEIGMTCLTGSSFGSPERYLVYIPYDQIWRISRNDEPTFEHRHDVYFNDTVMRAMFDELILNK